MAAIQHILGEFLRDHEFPCEVNIEDKAESALLEIEESLLLSDLSLVKHLACCCGPRAVAPRAIQQNIRFSQSAEDLFMCLLNVLCAEDVALHRNGNTPLRSDLVGHFFNRIKIDVKERDLGASGRKRPGHATAEDASGPGHNRDTTGEIHI